MDPSINTSAMSSVPNGSGQDPQQPVVSQPAPEGTASQGDPLQTPGAPNTRKWLIIGGAVLVVILAAGVGVLGYQNFQARQQTPAPTPTAASELPPAPPPVPGEPTTDETADWKTYTNTKYNYSLKYPIDWTVNLGVGGTLGDDSKLETIYQVKLNSNTIPEEKLTVWVWVGKSFNTTIDDFSNNLGKTKPDSESTQIYSKEKTVLGGVDALKYSRSQVGIGQVMEITAIKNSYEYTLSLEHPDTQPQNIPIFNQILSTFKFTE